MLGKAKKDIENFFEQKEKLKQKSDDLNSKYRSVLVDSLIKIIINIMKKIKRGTPNGTLMIDLYVYKDAPAENWDKYEDIHDISDLKLMNSDEELINLDFRLESVENKYITFRYSYKNSDNMHVHVNKDGSDIDLAILIYTINHLLEHPFFTQDNLKYLKKLNEIKIR